MPVAAEGDWSVKVGCGGVMSAVATHRYFAQRTASEEESLGSIRGVAGEVLAGCAEVWQFLLALSG